MQILRLFIIYYNDLLIIASHRIHHSNRGDMHDRVDIIAGLQYKHRRRTSPCGRGETPEREVALGRDLRPIAGTVLLQGAFLLERVESVY